MRLLTMNEIADALEGMPDLCAAQLSAFDDDLLSWRPDEGEWCIKEIIGHLIETDRIAFRGRIEQLLSEEEPVLGGMDVNAVAAARRDDARPLAELLDALREEREHAGSLVRGLGPSDLSRSGPYPRLGQLSVADLVYELSLIHI